MLVPGPEVEVEVVLSVARLRESGKRHGEEAGDERAGDEAREGAHCAMVSNAGADGNPHPEVTIR
jgi:hypothetical protein